MVTFVDQAKKLRNLTENLQMKSDSSFRKSRVICQIIDAVDGHFC